MLLKRRFAENQQRLDEYAVQVATGLVGGLVGVYLV